MAFLLQQPLYFVAKVGFIARQIDGSQYTSG